MFTYPEALSLGWMSGKRISQEERQQWNKKVLVYFQGKAWADQEFTEKYVGGKDWNL